MSSEAYYSIQVPKQKPLGPSFRGVFYSVFLWWLIPQAGHRLFITIQPFVDAMTRYTMTVSIKPIIPSIFSPPFRTGGRR